MSIRRASKSTLRASSQATPVKGSAMSLNYVGAVDEMDLIGRVVVGSGGVASVTFSDIPQMYQHLHIRYSIRATSNSVLELFQVRFNANATEANYWRHVIYSNGVTITSSQFNTWMNYHYITAANAIANNFSAGYINIPEYRSSKKKNIFSINGMNNAGIGPDDGSKSSFCISSGTWNQTPAITSVTLNIGTAENSVISLYGVKA